MRAGLLAAALLLAGCAARQSVVLLPGEPGHPVGALAVLNEDGTERGVLDSADSRARLAGQGRVKGKTVAAAAVDARYGALVGDLPLPPVHFTLNFDIGVSQPLPDQEAMLQAIFAAISARPGAEVQVVGHTDTTATPEINDGVSERRATEVRAYLIQRGLPASQIRATWRGERELAVPTADGVANAANRRVEVIVR